MCNPCKIVGARAVRFQEPRKPLPPSLGSNALEIFDAVNRRGKWPCAAARSLPMVLPIFLRTQHVEQIVGNLKRQSNLLAVLGNAGQSARRLGVNAPAANRRGSKRRSWRNGCTPGASVALRRHLQIRDLAADHSAICSDGVGQFADALTSRPRKADPAAPALQTPGSRGRHPQGSRWPRQSAVRGGFAAAQVVIIESRQIVVNQGVSVNQFERAAHA